VATVPLIGVILTLPLKSVVAEVFETSKPVGAVMVILATKLVPETVKD